MQGNREHKKNVGKTMYFSFIGLIVGILSLALVFVGDGMAKSIYPDPPPAPLLTRKDMSAIKEGEIKDAIVDFAAEVAVKSSRQLAESTTKAGENTVRKAWDTVKGLAGKSKKADPPAPEAEDGPEISSPSPVGDAPEEPEEKPVGDTSDKLGWRDVKVNLGSPASPDQEWLKGVFSNTALVGGLLALVLAMTGWIRREDQRVCICAAAMGVLAMAWVYLILAIAIAIVAAVIAQFQ